MLLTIDPATLRVTGVQLASGQIAGYAAEQALGRPLGDLFAPETRATVEAGARQLLRDGTPAELSLAVVLHDGQAATVRLSLIAARGEDGSVAPRLIVLRLSGVTPHGAPQALQEGLVATRHELDGLTYALSHDLRAPLRSVDGFARILAERHGAALPEEGQRYLGILRAGAQRMDRMVTALLALSRLGRAEIRKQPIDPAEVARAAVAELGDAARRPGLEIRIAELPQCIADRALLTQLFTNLLSNAVKFTRQRNQASIEVGCEASRDPPAYFVRDNGTGFDMRYAHKLFQPFQRLHRDEDYEGIGVGLALVARIVQRHGGRIWAEAEPDRGATFYFVLGRADG